MYVLQKPVGRGLYMMKRGGNGGCMRAVLDYCSQVPYQRRLAGSILVGALWGFPYGYFCCSGIRWPGSSATGLEESE